MKKILAILLFCLTFSGYSQTTLTLGRMDTLFSTGQTPNANNMKNILYTLYNRPGSGNNNAPLFFVTAATTTTLAPVTYSSGTLTAVSNGRLANVDGIKLMLYDSVLIKNQTAQLQNGIYIISDTGTVSTTAKMYRNPRYDASGEIYPSQVNVLSGTVNGGLYFLETTINPIVGTSSIVYTSIPAPTSWLLTGNSGTTAGTNFIGTNDAQPFVIKTNASEKVRVLTNGNVGIGTTTPTNDLSFGNTANRKIWIENTDSITAGKTLTVQSGSTIAGGAGGGFVSLSQVSRAFRGMAAAPNGDVYVCVYSGDIYKQTAGVGDFVALSQTSRLWYAMAAAPNGDVYACVYGGDIYMQTGGVGNFVSLSQGNGNWIGMTAAPDGDVYVCTNNGAGAGDIYKQTGGSGNFVSLSQTSRSWFGMAAAPDGDIYASVSSGDIYKQTNGAGNFIALSQVSRIYQEMAAAPNGDVYVCVNGGDIYKQTAGVGSFTALGQASRAWFGMAAAPDGDVYANTTSSAQIYKQSGGVDVNGGNLILSSGQSKGLGSSDIIFQTATTSTVTGTNLNTIETKMVILGNGNVGINTTSPEAKLDIQGDLIYKYEYGTPDSGDVMVANDTNGNVVWQTLTAMAIPQTWKIYVDAQSGANTAGSTRGQIQTPYATVEYVLANVVNTGTITATTTSTSATLTSVSSTANIAIGQFITGTGIPYNSVVTAFTSSTIVVSQPCTASAAVTTTWWIPYELVLSGNFTASSTWYKEGFVYNCGNSNISFSGKVFDRGVNIRLTPELIIGGNWYGISTSSQFYSYGNASSPNHDMVIKLNYFSSLGTGYQLGDNSNSAFLLANRVTIDIPFFECKAGGISYMSAKHCLWNGYKYGLIGGINILNSTAYYESNGKTETPTNINAIYSTLAKNIVVNDNILGSVYVAHQGGASFNGSIEGTSIQAGTSFYWAHNFNGPIYSPTTITIAGNVNLNSFESATVNQSAGTLNIKEGNGTFNISGGTCILNGLHRADFTVVVNTTSTGTMILNGNSGQSAAIGTISIGSGSSVICNGNYAFRPKDAIPAVAGTLTINKGAVYTWDYNTGSEGTVSGTVNIFGTVKLTQSFGSEVATTTPTIRLSTGTIVVDGGRVECAVVGSKSGLIRKQGVGGVLVLKGQPYLKVANGLAPVQILSNSGTSQDIFDFSLVDNCAVGFRLADTFTDVTYGTAYAPNLLIGGTKYEATTNTW